MAILSNVLWQIPAIIFVLYGTHTLYELYLAWTPCDLIMHRASSPHHRRHTTTHHNTLYHNDEIDEHHNYKNGEPRNSLILCRTLPDSYIVCEYEVLCSDGYRIYVVDEEVSEMVLFENRHPRGNPYPMPNHVEMGGAYLPPEAFTWRGKKQPYNHTTTTARNKKPYNSTVHNVHWLNGTTWMVPGDRPEIYNIAHFMRAYSAFWTLLTTEHSISLHEYDPEGMREAFGWQGLGIERLVTTDSAKSRAGSYFMGVLETMLPPEVPIYWSEDFGRSYHQNNNDKTPIRVPEGTPRRPPPEDMFPQHTMVCMERAFVGGWWWQFGGDVDATEFRRRLYSKFGLEMQPRPPMTVVMIDRFKENRALVDPTGLMKVLTKLGLPYKYLKNMHGSLEDHVRLYHSAGALLNPHGAGNTNSFFMQPGSAMLEMHGYGHDFGQFYHIKATMAGVHYHEQYDFIEDKPRYKSEKERWYCIENIKWGRSHECLWALWRDVNPNIFLFEYFVVAMMREVGHNIKPSSDFMVLYNKTARHADWPRAISAMRLQ